MKFLKIIIPTILGILLISCGSSVKTVRPNKADLSKYDTYAYLPNASLEMKNLPNENDYLNSFMIETINDEMKESGYTLDRDNPDLLVLVSVSTDLAVKRKNEPVYARFPYGNAVAATPISPFYQSFYYRGWHNWYYPGGVIGYTTDTYSYEEGTVVVDLIDRKTKQSVWKGRTSEPILNQTKTEAVIDAINDIFKNYPLNE
ncbi:DUF4136 domain-containing protein [Psychroflexus aestuariivivens]|uniref:DUF4136 domain-containing protein n=1 Tax=Psychroflexus aestuariivivens TaxID=1795040 RepID=UPI000FDB9894|nr:DUF4136 domain-containing protein [Psychroflexus aestuariivivens]